VFPNQVVRLAEPVVIGPFAGWQGGKGPVDAAVDMFFQGKRR